jgi:hypothetical protein
MSKGRMEEKTPKKKSKAQIIKEAGKKKFLIPSSTPIQPEQALYIAQKTPSQHIYTRKGKGGQVFDYVKGSYVKKVLNFTFGFMWDFIIVDKGREGNQVWVQGRLSIRNKKGEVMIIKEQFGRADIKFYKDKARGMVDYGNDLKAASTDALKKCASELGISADVYNNEEDQIIRQEQQPQQPTQQPKTEECHECADPITAQVKNYSLKVFGKQLCQKCQVEAKKGNIKINR